MRAAAAVLVGLLTVAAAPHDNPAQQTTASVKDLIAQLGAPDPVARANAACELAARGDNAVDAIQGLIGLLADPSPVQSPVCERRWWRGGPDDVTTPGEQAAGALVSIGTRAFQPVLNALRAPTWVTRRNAAWALGALDDRRAVAPLVDTLKDREPGVREQAAWALGAIDDTAAVPALIRALEDQGDRVRKQAAWALGAIDDSRAVDGLVHALSDKSTGVRKQAAWALGAIGDSRALPGLLPRLKDEDPGVRKQAAWAIGVIGK
jgi:HEAT repeat protein